MIRWGKNIYIYFFLLTIATLRLFSNCNFIRKSICIDKRLLVSSNAIVPALTRMYIHLSKLYFAESVEADCRILLLWLRDLPLPRLTCNSWVPTARGRNAKVHFVPDAVGEPEVAVHFAIPMPVLHVSSDVTDGQLKCYNLLPARCLASAGCAVFTVIVAVLFSVSFSRAIQ